MKNLNNSISKTKTNTFKVLRVNESVFKKVDSILQKANKKKYGKSVRANDLISLALDLIDESHIKQLQESTLNFEDQKELLRLIYIKKKGQISKDSFTGFMMSPAFQDFLNENKTALKVV